MKKAKLAELGKEPALDGVAVRRLMRVHRRTIRTLAKAMNVTMKRVREVRDKGVSGELAVWEWTTWIVEGEIKW